MKGLTIMSLKYKLMLMAVAAVVVPLLTVQVVVNSQLSAPKTACFGAEQDLIEVGQMDNEAFWPDVVMA